MSLIFGGKLLAPKHYEEDAEKNNPAFGIRHLSKREKQLLEELSKTRSEIVKELVHLGPSLGKSDLDLWRDTLDEYQDKLDLFDSRHIPSRRQGARSLTFSKTSWQQLGRESQSQVGVNGKRVVKSRLDSLPILSASCSLNLPKQAGMVSTIQLPVVTLPMVRGSSSPYSEVYQKSDSLAKEECGMATTHKSTVASSNTIFQDMGNNSAFIRQYLSLSAFDLLDIQMSADKILQSADRESGVIAHADEVLTSVFMSVKHMDSRINDSSARNTSSAIGGNSLPVISSPHNSKYYMGKSHSTKNLSSRSLPFEQSFPTLGSLHSQDSNSRRKKSTGSVGQAHFAQSHKRGSQRSVNRKQTRQAWAQHESSPEENLRQELMASIGNMQRHTAEVKQGILGVQELVALSNPKARSFVMSMAADQLCVTLTRLGRRQLKRGWDAWNLCLRTDFLKAKAVLLRRFMRLRTICSLFNGLVYKVLKYNFVEWVKFCVAERLRVEMEIKTAAATFIQRIARGVIGREKAKQAAEGHKFQKMHKSLVKLQALFRCKLLRWKYLKYMREVLEETSCELIQRIVRGFIHRRRVRRIRMYKDKESAAITIQAAARGMKGRKKASEVRLLRLKNKVIVKIQALARGYIGRSRVEKILQDKAEAAAAVKIQARIRGAVIRMNLHHRRRELDEYRSEKSRVVTLIQATYRGFRARVMVRYYMEERNKLVSHQNACALKIQCMVRMFLARSRVLKLHEDRIDMWVLNASKWKEMWAEDSGTWFYINEATQEALWEPPPEGYTKNDGQLVLENGKIIDPPDRTGKKKRAPGEEHLCVECVTRVAIRSCNECGDKFCTKCYKESHASGSRKQHTYEATGPIDCTECEEQLAERWCISCDEAYCDSCWRKVHSKGKRRYHPFSQVLEDGHVDNRIFTIDGEQVHNYDASYAQSRYEEDTAATNGDTTVQWGEDYNSYEEGIADDYYAQDENQQGGLGSEYDNYADASYENAEDSWEDTWSQYYDDNNFPYWYNNKTGESTFDDPHTTS